jgi:putative transposase
MARHARLIVPGIALHIRQRGNNGQDCFRARADYLVYLAMFREIAAPRPCEVHAYCLMTNHVHLLLTPRDERSCALLMRDLGGCYASYFNRRYARTGSLWEGRFRSCLVDSAAYVLACYRYIERNPVRAGMVPGVQAYEWSSFAVNSGAASDRLITPHAEYGALAADALRRQGAYREFVQMSDDPVFVLAAREALGGGYPLVGDALKAELATDGKRVAAAKPGPNGKLTK